MDLLSQQILDDVSQTYSDLTKDWECEDDGWGSDGNAENPLHLAVMEFLKWHWIAIFGCLILEFYSFSLIIRDCIIFRI